MPWFLRCLESPSCSAKFDPCVLAVKNDLQQDGHVDQDLDRTAHPELSRALVHHEVDGLEDVTGRPQHHHLHTGAMEAQRDVVKVCGHRELRGFLLNSFFNIWDSINTGNMEKQQALLCPKETITSRCFLALRILSLFGL